MTTSSTRTVPLPMDASGLEPCDLPAFTTQPDLRDPNAPIYVCSSCTKPVIEGFRGHPKRFPSGMTLKCPWCGAVLLFTPELERRSDDPYFVVVMVHGTWGAPGIFDKIQEELSDLSALFERFQWSGRNSQQARHDAIGRLSDRIEQLLHRYPASHLYVIGHSHGGGIAWQAVNMEPDDRDTISGLITLATPFLSISRRDGVVTSLDFQFGVAAVIAVITYLQGRAESYLWAILAAALGFLFAVVKIGALDRIGEMTRFHQDKSLPPGLGYYFGKTNALIIMPEGDEAYRVLTAGLGFARMAGGIVRLILRACEWFEDPWRFWPAAVVGVIVAVSLAPPEVLIAFRADPLRYIEFGVLAGIVLYLMYRGVEAAITSVFLGPQLGLMAPFVRVKLDRSPPNGASVEVVRLNARGFAHSAIHQDHQVVARIRHWIVTTGFSFDRHSDALTSLVEDGETTAPGQMDSRNRGAHS